MNNITTDKLKQIDHDCSILPREATFLDNKKNVHFDDSFAGVKFTEASHLDTYLHFRKPESAQAIALLRSVELTTRTDFLDPLSKDSPKGRY